MTERSIFVAAIEIKDRAARQAYVSEACGPDDALRERVIALLKTHDLAGSFLQSPPSEVSQTVERATLERPGICIGPYKLLQELGEGGMGTVFLAEQTHPLKRQVALKVIKAGMDTRQVIARFEAERQALALMDHVNIARVLDAGTTESVRPYFVMELVHGVPITKYCDDNRLTPRERLELFLPVCQAIQHAHQKGIIHRDLKPSNVMITLYDGKPAPKVIDFGVAKATEQRLTERTLFTQYGTMVGTFEYMSPEQAEMSALGVDTRSDVYSLGVLLYELLTGSTPLSHKRVREAAYGEVLRIIKEEEPPKPSTRLSDSGEALASISAQRHMEPAKLTKLLRGELDWIVMKCLEKDRNRRYETANDFAVDVQRYLSDESVQACPPSATYRLRKFVRRNKGPVLAATFIFLLLLGGIIGTTLGLVRALRAEQLASERLVRVEKAEGLAQTEAQTAKERAAETQAVLDFVESKVFAAARPEDQDGGLGPEVTLRKAVEAAASFVDHSFPNQPLIEARLRITLGISFAHLSDAKTAAEQFETARTLFTKHLGPDHVNTLASMNNLALCYGGLGRHFEALKLHEETLALRKAKLGPDHPDTLDSMSNLAVSYQDLGKYAAALKLNEETLVLQKTKFGLDHYGTLRSMNNLALSYDYLGRHADACKLLEETLALMKTKLGSDHPDTLKCMINLATNYEALGKHDEALKLREVTLVLQEAKLGPNHRSTLLGMHNLALSYGHFGRHDDALKLLGRTLALQKAKLGPDHPDTLRSMSNLAGSYKALGKHAVALKLHEETLALQKAKLGPDHPDTLRNMHNLADSYGAVGRYADARQLFEETLALMKTKLGPDHPDTLRTIRGLAISYMYLGRDADALNLGDQAIAAYRKAIDLDPKSIYSHIQLGAALAKKGDRDAAIVEYRTVIQLDAKSALAHAELGSALCESGDFAAGAMSLQKSTELSPNDAWRWYQLANAYLALGDRDGYRRVCAEMMNRYEKNNEPYWANRILYACAPAADSLADVSALNSLAQVADSGKLDKRALGAALYRNRKYPEAIVKLNEATQERAWDNLFLAMAHHRIGDTDKAREYLKIAINRLETSRYPWTERIESETLRREAETLINGSGSDPGSRAR